MNKKRRNTENCELIDLVTLKTSLIAHIATEASRIEEAGLLTIKYQILPKFGKGLIIETHFDGIVISISRFMLNNDFMIYNYDKKNKIQLSFLLEGEKIIGLNTGAVEFPYESQESYMAYIKTFNGYSRISGDKPYKEIKIILSKSFLSQYSVPDNIDYKKINDKNLIIPITNDLFSVLSDLETKSINGISRKIYLKAKVLEILAIQIDNYNNIKINDLSIDYNKHLKKLYKLKLFLKNNLNKNYSINQMSGHIGLTENVLRSEFKRVFELTITQYFTQKKMNRAKYLLENTELPIYEIAETVGYKNATHFSAAFKKFYDETPRGCRVKM